jgi:hypothetical protein
MPNPTQTELKKALVTHGFEIYRTLGVRLLLADRVRDNLIMDSGVSVTSGDLLTVRFVARAQGNDFPSESAEQLFVRARRLGKGSTARGYVEVATTVMPILDPGDRSRTLDTWYEVAFEKSVGDVDELVSELKYALGLVKTVAVGARA